MLSSGVNTTKGILLWKSNQLQMLLEISKTLAVTHDIQELFQKIVDSAAKIMNLGSAAIYLLNNEEELNLEATFPPLPDNFPVAMKKSLIANHPHIQKVILSKKAVVVSDIFSAQLTKEEQDVAVRRNLHSMLYIPLCNQGRAIGVLIIGSIARVHEFSSDEIDICHALANQAALEIERTILFHEKQTYIEQIEEQVLHQERTERELLQAYDELNHAYETTIESLTRGLELRDFETKGHCRRVVELTLKLAKLMGIPENELVTMQRGALLHDIGKMGIPDAILLKPGSLSETEWEQMKRHPLLAYEMLYPIEYLRPALTIPLYHHEKYDGTGYPHGLKGENIPIGARIFAIVDVYDALTNDRPYRKAWTKQAALQHIKEQSGYHFDPQVVEAFLSLLQSINSN